MSYLAEVTCPGCSKTFQHELPLAPGTDLMQQEGEKMAQEAKLIHSHIDELLKATAQRSEDRPVTVDVAGPLADALAPLDRRVEALQEAVTSHPTPATAIEHWKSCPTCKPSFEAALDAIRPLPKLAPSPPPAAVAAPPQPAEKPKPAPLKRKGYDTEWQVPESRFVREGYGLKTVQGPDGKFYVQAESEKAGKEAVGMGVAEKGCEFKCDETGCWWLCEKR